MTVNLAKFTINSTPSIDGTGKRGFDATASQVLTVQLEQQPSLVLSATFAVYDPNDSTSPLASRDATLQTWDTNSLPSITITDTSSYARADV